MAVCLSDSPPSQGPCCPVCYRDYSDSNRQLIPRILQCGHTYCSECLDKLLNTEPDEDDYQEIVLNIRYAGREWTTARNYPRSRYSTNELKCPTCKSMNPVHNKDVSTLTKNFALLGCLQPPPTHKNKHFCKDHNHEKRIYCNDCKVLICAYCQLYGGHTGHSYEVATEAAKPSLEALKQVDTDIERNLEKLEEGKKKVEKTVRKLDRRRERSEKKVKRYFESSMARLRVEKDLLLEKMKDWSSEQRYVLTSQLEMLIKYSRELRSLQSNCQSLVLGDPLDALTGCQSVEEEVKHVQSNIKDLSLQPLIQPWLKVQVLDESVWENSLQSIVDNFQLSYDTSSSSKQKKKAEESAQEGGASAGAESAAAAVDDYSFSMDESKSSVDSCSDEMDSLSDGRQTANSALPRPPQASSNGGNGQGRGPETIFSQESHNQPDTRDNVGGAGCPADGNVSHGYSISPDLSWLSMTNHVPSSNLFNVHRRRRRLTQTPSGESDSAPSDEEQAPSYSLPSARLIGHQLLMEAASSGSPNVHLVSPRLVMDPSTDESDQEHHTHHHDHGHALLQQYARQSPTGFGGGGGGVNLDPLGVRRHWQFLNDHLGTGEEEGAVGGESGKEEDDDDDENENEEIAMTLHSLMYEPSARSAPPSESSSPSPRLFNSSGNDFAYAHHLSLPPGGNVSSQDEVVFSNPPPFFQWTRQHSNPLQVQFNPFNNDDLDSDED